MNNHKEVLVIGGAGYVGTRLVPILLNLGYKVCVYDIFWFCDESVFSSYESEQLTIVKGDIRDREKLSSLFRDDQIIIHLACVSNDPSFDLRPELSKSINYDCFENIVIDAKKSGVKKFIYASSSSVYGVKEEPDVTEDLRLEPLTDYSKYKALCETTLLNHLDETFTGVILRPATVCGPSPRQRLDVVVNILTNHAYHNGKIKIYNGEQKRPNIHIEDMCQAYIKLIEAPCEKVNKKIYNIGTSNLSVEKIASLVSSATGVNEIEVEKNDDLRSYHISSQKFYDELGFRPQKTIKDAIEELRDKFQKKELNQPLTNPLYFNVKYFIENAIE